MDSGSLYHFCHDCRIGNFGRFISTLHTVTDWLLLIEPGEMTDADNGMNPLNFDIDLAADQSGFKSRIFLDDELNVQGVRCIWHWQRYTLPA